MTSTPAAPAADRETREIPLEFVMSAYDLKSLPAATAEVAFAGRSNVGKSSALNTLARRRNLVRVSNTPGRTQALNYFRIGAGSAFLVDLPGYGYAKVSKTVREQWGHLIEGYLKKRRELRGLVLVTDARHPLTDLDQALLEWFAPAADRPVHILITKADKLTRQEQTAVLRAVQAAIADRPNCSAQLFSASTRLGLEAAKARLAAWLPLAPTPDA